MKKIFTVQIFLICLGVIAFNCTMAAQNDEYKRAKALHEEQRKAKGLTIELPTPPKQPAPSQAPKPVAPKSEPETQKAVAVPKAQEKTPSMPAKTPFSFKKFFGFGTSEKATKTEPPVSQKEIIEQLTTPAKTVKADLTQIPQDVYTKFASLGGSVTPKDLSEKEKQVLIDIGNKLLGMSKENMNALSPEEKLNAFVIMKARTVQFQMGENLAAKLEEDKGGIRRTIEAKKKNATKDELQKLQAQLEQKDKDMLALKDMYGFDFPKTEDLADDYKKHLASEQEKYKRSLNTLSQSMGTEVDLRINIVKSQEAEVAKITKQKLWLTAGQKRTRDTYCRNMLALYNLAQDAKNGEAKKVASLASLDVTGATDRLGGKENVEKAKRELQQQIAEGQRHVDQVQELLAGSKATLKKIAPSFIKAEQSRIKALETMIAKKKSDMTTTLAQHKKLLQQLGSLKDSIKEEQASVGQEIGKLKSKIRGEPYTVKKDGKEVTQYKPLPDEERTKLETELAGKNARFEALTAAARSADEEFQKRTAEEQKKQSEELALLQKEQEKINDGIKVLSGPLS